MAGIFKAYDIRGTVPDQLDEVIAQKIGYAYAMELKAKAVAVGNDMRVSADQIKSAFIKGVTAAGTDVYDVGMCSTPFTYFASGALDVDGAAMVTASHNPQQYNGFKLSKKNALPIAYETGINNIEKTAMETDSIPDATGKVIPTDLFEKYKNHVLSFTEIKRKLTIVIDAGNGMGGVESEKIFGDLDIEIIPLYFEPDGSFPNHEPNPLKAENVADLQAKVRETGADLGAAFDGDADRVFFVDEQGEIVSADLITALFAGNVLSSEENAAVIYDLRSSGIVKEEVERMGGKAIESRVGHSYIKGVMREHNAPLGGELSGHFYFRDNYYADSGLIALGKLLTIVSAGDTPLSKLIKPFRKYFASGEINFEVEDKEGKIKQLAETFSDADVYYLDGITVRYPDWWFNVRMSNTEPLLRLNLEAGTEEKMKKGVEKVQALLKE